MCLYIDTSSSSSKPDGQQPGVLPVDDFTIQNRLLDLVEQYEVLKAHHLRLRNRKRLVLHEHELSNTKSKIII